MRYYQVLLADAKYRSATPLTYGYEEELKVMSIVTVPLKEHLVTAFVWEEVGKPKFATKTIKSLVSNQTLPPIYINLAKWMAEYYFCTLGEALRQYAPSKPSMKPPKDELAVELVSPQLEFKQPLTTDQAQTIAAIDRHKGTTVLLHGDTGTGKTRVYLELAEKVLARGQSVIILTPEIALTTHLALAVEQKLNNPTYVLHSQLTPSARKKIWLSILEADHPVVVIGARSALFSPMRNLGLIVLDEAHEPSYKQEQSPRYHAGRVASQLGVLTGARVVLGTATPSLTDYFVAGNHQAIVRMKTPAVGVKHTIVKSQIVDLKNRSNFTSNPYVSNQLLEAIRETLLAKQQVLIYLNRRGTARLILCVSCGWQMECPNCDIPLVYHNDEYLVRCHTCGHRQTPPNFCPNCKNPDVIYKSIGTKALADSIARLFPDHSLQRFDSDNETGERVNELYSELHKGKIDIIVGTQLLAKGLDLPKLGLVGIVAAESSLSLPDYSSEERSFQLLYQVMGRVGRGHGKGRVVVQSYNPKSVVLRSAINRKLPDFYEYALADRQKYKFPPFSYLLQLICRRTTLKGAQSASEKLAESLRSKKLPVEIIGPTPSFFARRGKYYYWQIIVKSKDRKHLLEIARATPADWTVNLDPVDLL
ncbi:primosomal protein N' [Candidatus Saccharibacteria bacterium]|nr:primosomal protein N' [Candidatus Saccharibacteria bacterium]